MFKKKIINLFNLIRPDCIKGHTFLLRKIDKNGIILDLGSNQGEFTKILRKHRQDVMIFSIEANEKQKLLEMDPIYKKYNENVILSGHNGIQKFYRIRSKEKKGQDYFGDIYSIINDKKFSILETQEKECISLRSFVNKIKLHTSSKIISLIKLDVEGAEIKSLNSLTKEDFLSIDQITLEFHGFMFESLKEEELKLIDFIKKNNFYFFDFSLKESFRDVLFVKKNKINFFEIIFFKFITLKFFKNFLKNNKTFFRNYLLFLYRNYIFE